MASLITVLLVCCVSVVVGDGVYKQNDIKKTSRDIRTVRRAVNVVKRSSSDPTFKTKTVGRELQRNGNPVFLNAIELNRIIFLDIVLDNIPFEEKMQNIHYRREDIWKDMKKEIVDVLPCYKESISDSQKVDDFYSNIIHVYTAHSCIYKSTNAELRNCNNCTPTLGLYALMLNVVLTQWKNVSKYQNTTYHGVNFDTDEYTVDTVFTWPAFTSSSKLKEVGCRFAETALFIIDNSVDSDWRPKDIKAHSQYRTEYECLYPAAAIFKVTGVGKDYCVNKGRFYKAIYISLQPDQQTPDSQTGTAAILRWTMRVETVFAPFVAIATVVILV